MIPAIEKHFKENYGRIVKRMSFRAGTIWDGEDVVMEAYSRAILYYRAFDGTNFDKWFSTILRNCLKEHRYGARDLDAVEFNDDEVAGSGCNSYNGRMSVLIYSEIKKRSPVHAEILMLYFHQEYSAIDISRMTDYKYGMIHQTILRFKNELKGMYNEADY
jgi:DNA-directed RNA polymerase specialized sigma24 family protein